MLKLERPRGCRGALVSCARMPAHGRQGRRRARRARRNVQVGVGLDASPTGRA